MDKKKSVRGLRPVIISPIVKLPDNFKEMWDAASIMGKSSLTFDSSVVYGTRAEIDIVEIGLGWSTLIEYAPVSSDKVGTAEYWKAVWDPKVKSSTVEDLKIILEAIKNK